MAWAPAYGQDRRKDYSRAANRARALRKNETPHEKRLWRLLRELNREGANFRRQANVGHKVFDFADLGRKILIELDGAVHEQPDVREADKQKEIDAILRGYRVVRITNEELRRDSGAVLRSLRALLCDLSLELGQARRKERAAKHFLDRADAAAAEAQGAGNSRPSPQRGEGWEGGRTRFLSRLEAQRGSAAEGCRPRRPLPLPPPRGAGEESAS